MKNRDDLVKMMTVIHFLSFFFFDQNVPDCSKLLIVDMNSDTQA